MKANYKYKLTNVILYAKGWYEKGDLMSDLKKLLRLDDYTPFNDSDIYRIILHQLEHSGISPVKLIDGISPSKCWEYGYRVKGSFGSDTSSPDYEFTTAVIYYVLHIFRFINNDQWNSSIVSEMDHGTKIPEI